MASFADLIERLAAFYGPLPAPPADAFGYFVWEILGTKTTAGRRDSAMAALRRIPALTPDSLRKVPRGLLESILRQSGPFVDERLSALDAGVGVFRRQPHFTQRLHGPFRDAWIAARDLPHLGRAGALRLLMFTTDSTVVPVDAGIVRVVTRLGLVSQRPSLTRLARDVRRALNGALARDLAERRRAIRYLSHHAEHACAPADPHCRLCPLQSDCQEGTRRAAL